MELKKRLDSSDESFSFFDQSTIGMTVGDLKNGLTLCMLCSKLKDGE